MIFCTQSRPYESQNIGTAECLWKAVEDHGIEAGSLGEMVELRAAYQSDWLQAEMIYEELALYLFPSLLHHR
jgi:hypothetical protein